MKILYIANVRLPTERAHGLQIMKMCEAFALKGNTVLLFTPYAFNDLSQDPFLWYDIPRIFTLRTIRSFDWRQADRFGLMRAAYLIHVFYFSLRAYIHALSVRPDMIYCRHLILAALLSRVIKVVVFEDHEPPATRRLWYAFLLRHIPYKIVVPVELGALYRALGVSESKFSVVPNGVDLKEFSAVRRDHTLWADRFGIPPNLKIALYLGHFYPWKGVYTVGEAVSHLSNDSAVVFVGGTAENLAAMEEFVATHALPRVYVLPFLPHRDVLPLLKSADVLLLPNTASEERSLRYTTPLKLFEYMASSVPIVASDLPSFRTYLSDGVNALLARPDDPRDLAEKVNTVLSNKALARRLAGKALHDVQAYSWERRAERILSFVG